MNTNVFVTVVVVVFVVTSAVAMISASLWLWFAWIHQVAAADIWPIILAEAINSMLGKNNKLAEFITNDDPAVSASTATWEIDGDEVSEVILPSAHPVGGPSEDGGANVCDSHLVDTILILKHRFRYRYHFRYRDLCRYRYRSCYRYCYRHRYR